MFNQHAFSTNYGKLVAKIWSDPSVFDALKANPAATLKNYGIDTKAGAKIYVVKVDPTGEGTVERQIADWQKGDHDGAYYLWIPNKPENLGSNVAADTSTTCTPCTTCT
jgi:hypothetical protein